MKKIKPINNNGSIIIRFSFEGNRFNLSTGGNFNNKADLDKANYIAAKIMLDISQGEFDPSLLSYGGTAKNPEDDLKNIWSKYRNFKSATLAKSTLKKDFDKRVGNCLKKLPTTDLNNSTKIRDWLLANKTASEARRILVQLKACCKWATQSGLIFYNPFDEMPSQIKLKRCTQEDINPFTLEERDKIIQAFKSSTYYSYYCPLVEFIFYTGCRPSEALALEWTDVILGKKIIFNKAWVEQEKQTHLKTQKKRIINLNEQVENLIGSIQKRNYLIFPSKGGHYIDWHNFHARAWKKVLETLPEIEYRNPYQMRHTHITLALNYGVLIADIAKNCGNSPEIILKNYAGVTRDFVMPVF